MPLERRSHRQGDEVNRNLRRACGVALGAIGLALSLTAPADATPHDQCGLLGCLLSTGTKAVQHVVGGVSGTLGGQSGQSSAPRNPQTPPPPRSSSPSQPSAPSQPSQPSAPSQSSSGSGKSGQAASGTATGDGGSTSAVQPQSRNSVPLPAGSASGANGGGRAPAAQPVWPAPGAGAGSGNGVGAGAGAKHGRRSALELAAANTVHSELALELAIIAVIGGVGIVLYRSHLHAPRYVGRRRQTSPHPHRAHASG